MREGTYDPEFLIPHLYEGATGDVSWDIGTSYGNTLGLLVSRFTTVIGFEPSQLAMEYLRTVDSIQGVRVLQLAISDREGKVELGLEEGHVRVPCRSIDSLTKKLPMPDFVKVDVIGHEVEVLKGATFAMITRGPNWLVEIYSAENSQKCQNILSYYGYKCTIIFDPDDRDPVNHHWIRATLPLDVR